MILKIHNAVAISSASLSSTECLRNIPVSELIYRSFMNNNLKRKQSYLKFVGNISVIRQSSAALPQLITLLNTADTIRFCFVLVTKYIPLAQRPEENVLKTET
jgi:hypothetical protein